MVLVYFIYKLKLLLINVGWIFIVFLLMLNVCLIGIWCFFNKRFKILFKIYCLLLGFVVMIKGFFFMVFLGMSYKAFVSNNKRNIVKLV